MKKSTKTVRRVAPAPHRIIREFTPAERERWERAVAEERAPQGRERAERTLRGLENGRTALRNAFKLLRAERERQGLSLSDMQNRTDMDRSTLCALENAEEPNPTIGTLCRVAQALGLTIEISLHKAK